jgi:hypothetical protein
VIQSNSHCHQIRAKIGYQLMLQVSRLMKAIWYVRYRFFDSLLTYVCFISSFRKFTILLYESADNQGTQSLQRENRD